MGELKKVSLQRAVEKQVKEMMVKWELKRTRQIRLQSSALCEITQLRRARSLWPPVMRELTLKFAYKNEECCKKVLVEEDWTSECESNALEQEGWVTDDDNDDDDSAAAAPAPIQRPALANAASSRSSRRATLHSLCTTLNFQLFALMSIRF